VAPCMELVEVDEAFVGALGPTPWRLVALAGEDAHGNWDRDVLYAEEAELVLPVEAIRGNASVRGSGIDDACRVGRCPSEVPPKPAVKLP
jgi:hypothetical protein